MYIHLYTCINMYIHVYINVYTGIYMYIHVYTWVYMCISLIQMYEIWIMNFELRIMDYEL